MIRPLRPHLRARSDLDVLLATKLHVPRSNPGLVPRPRLAEQLDEGLGRGLILACAPAGYGKTALLADWARRGRRPVAWLSLDTADNDPARFWRYVVAALDRACPGIGERVGPLLGPPAPPSFERLLEALINEVAARLGDGEALLVLDDYHVISSEPVHASLRFLLEQRPPGLRLILASRSDPPLSLARLRARGQLAELRAAELRFTAEEAAALLQQMAAAPGRGPVRMRPWRRWRRGPRGGRPVFSSLACRCAARMMSPDSWRHSPAAIATCWITWPRRCSSGRASWCAHSSWKPRCWNGSAARCAMRSPAGRVTRRCWSTWSRPACSWRRWTRCAAGGAITTCSPTCSAPACTTNSPAAFPSCTAPRRLVCRSTAWPTTRYEHAVAASDMTLGSPAHRAALQRGLLLARRGGDDPAVDFGASR